MQSKYPTYLKINIIYVERIQFHILIHFGYNLNEIADQANFFNGLLSETRTRIFMKHGLGDAVINCHLLGDFCLADFKFLTDFYGKLGGKLAICVGYFQNGLNPFSCYVKISYDTKVMDCR